MQENGDASDADSTDADYLDLKDDGSVLDDIRNGIEEMNAGRGRSIKEIDAEIRREFNIPHRRGPRS